METRIVNRAGLVLALVAVLLFGLTAAARADGVSVPTAATAIEAGAGPASATGSGAASNAAATVAQAAAPYAGTAPAVGADTASAGQSQAAEAAGDAQRNVAIAGSDALPGEGSTLAAPVAKAVQEAALQASAKQPPSADGAAGETLAAESNATTQLAWQVQIAECVAHCVGTRQSQVAEQDNTTVQVAGSAQHNGGRESAATSEAPSVASSEVRQIQLGCVAHCVGATTTTAASSFTGYWRLLEHLLREVGAGLATLNARPAIDSDAVEQTSYQLQSGSGEASAQLQRMAQVSYNEQLRAAGAESQASGAEAGELFNETTQAIWQLQVGCLIFCQETTQYQQAEQSNSTTQTAPAATAGASAAAANVATQLIWQAQIGCLFFCYDATEQQVASADNVYSRLPLEAPATSAPEGPTSPPPSATETAVGPVSGASASPPSGGGFAPVAVGGLRPAVNPPPAVGLVGSERSSRRARVRRSRANARRPVSALATGALGAQPVRGVSPLTVGPQRAAFVAPAAPTPPLSLFGSTTSGSFGASGSNVAGVALAAAIALLGLFVVCVAVLRTTRRVPAAPREH
jgi:hypothetical protein